MINYKGDYCYCWQLKKVRQFGRNSNDRSPAQRQPSSPSPNRASGWSALGMSALEHSVPEVKLTIFRPFWRHILLNVYAVPESYFGVFLSCFDIILHPRMVYCDAYFVLNTVFALLSSGFRFPRISLSTHQWCI